MCQGCPPNTPPSFQLQYLYNPNCTPPQEEGCCCYTGPTLSCTGITKGDSLEVALQKIEGKVCASSGSYAGFNFGCLTGITDEHSFVQGISAYVCSLRSDLGALTEVVYNTDQTAQNTRITALEKPNVTGCSTYLTFTTNDSLQTVLNKISAKVCSIHTTELDISGVTWNSCLTAQAPTTIGGAFQLLADQICAINTGGGVTLPHFNNTGSCLPSPGSSDSLEDTIGKIKTRLCQTGTVDINTLTWGCITKPSGTATDLQGTLQTVLTTLNDYKQNKISFSNDFTVDAGDEDDACAGLIVSLATPLNQDKLVGATHTDSSPGSLQEKLQAGTNVTLDYATPGKVIINSAGGAGDGTVKVASGGTAGYLADKVTGSTGDFLTISPTINGDTVQLLSSFNMSAFLPFFFDALEADDAMKTRFCQLVASCPSPCSSPENPQAVIVS